jgi:hypothetical protein
MVTMAFVELGFKGDFERGFIAGLLREGWWGKGWPSGRGTASAADGGRSRDALPVGSHAQSVLRAALYGKLN